MKEISVAIVDDQNLFRQSLALLINSEKHLNLTAECEGGVQFLSVLDQPGTPVDVAIIDMDMPGMNGIQLNKALHERYPKIKVIILSVHVIESLITKMINAGAASYLAKNCNKDELILAIDTVYSKGFYFNNEVLAAIRNSNNHKTHSPDIINTLPIVLTRREKQVLRLVCEERNNAEIAQELYLSIRTIEGHRINLINKINCRNTAGLVLFAIKFGLFDLPL